MLKHFRARKRDSSPNDVELRLIYRNQNMKYERQKTSADTNQRRVGMMAPHYSTKNEWLNFYGIGDRIEKLDFSAIENDYNNERPTEKRKQCSY